jgi:hypothetical protein
MMFSRRDPGPCPVDDAPHTSCCAPGSPPSHSGVIIAGPIVPATTVTVASDVTPATTTPTAAPPAGESATANWRPGTTRPGRKDVPAAKDRRTRA